MTDTPNLALPYILAAQSQKHITHNEAIRALDCLVQIAVLDRDLGTPPSTPGEGARYIVAASPTGAWSGATGKLAAFQDGAWEIYTPNEGWLAWIADENALVVYDGVGWAAVSSGGGGGTSDHGLLTGLGDDDHPHYHNDARGDARYTPIAPSTFGINATADTTNRLALSSAASLFNHAGSGHQQKINKASSAQIASQLYQSNFSGRAEIGLLGDDDFRFKVSPDGTTFHDAIVIDRNNGRVVFPKSSYREVLTTNRTYFVRGDGNNANSGLVNNSGGAFLTIQKALDVAATLDFAGFIVTVQVADGTYTSSSVVPVCVGQTSAASLVIRGNSGSPANVIVSATSNNCFSINQNAMSTIQDMELRTTTGGICLQASGTGAALYYSNIRFGACASAHVFADSSSQIIASGNYTISGSALQHWFARNGATINADFRTVTLSGTPAFSTAFAFAQQCGAILAGAMTFSGSGTGKRYDATLNGVINTVGAGASALPGNAAGTTATGGQYA